MLHKDYDRKCTNEKKILVVGLKRFVAKSNSDSLTKSVCTGVVKKGVSWESPFREDLRAETEESSLLEAVTRERLVKTQQAGKGLAGAVVICIVWRLAVALELLVVPSRVVKWSISPTSNPKSPSRDNSKAHHMTRF
jgi:hypothetical protein